LRTAASPVRNVLMVQVYKQDHTSIYASHASLLPFMFQAHSTVRWKYFRFVQYVCVIIGAHKLMLYELYLL